MCSSSGRNCLRLEDGRTRKSKSRGQFDDTLIRSGWCAPPGRHTHLQREYPGNPHWSDARRAVVKLILRHHGRGKLNTARVRSHRDRSRLNRRPAQSPTRDQHFHQRDHHDTHEKNGQQPHDLHVPELLSSRAAFPQSRSCHSRQFPNKKLPVHGADLTAGGCVICPTRRTPASFI